MSDYPRLLAEALAASACQTGTLHWLDSKSGLLRLKGHTGLPEEVAKIVETVPVGKGMAGLAAERREPVQTCNLQTDPSSDIRPGAKAVPVQASIAIPIIVDGRLCGVLGLAKTAYHEWDKAEIDVLRSVATQLGRDIEAVSRQ